MSTATEVDVAPHLAGLAPSDRELVQWLAGQVTKRGLTVPAILMLEGTRPLTFLGSQTLIFFQPIVTLVFKGEKLKQLARLLEDRESVELLLLEIEAQDAALMRERAERRATWREERKTRWKRRLRRWWPQSDKAEA